MAAPCRHAALHEARRGFRRYSGPVELTGAGPAMFSFQYCPNRTSRVLEVEIDPLQRGPGTWDVNCKIYEQSEGRRLLLGPTLALRDIPAQSEQECLDEAEIRIADEIENDRWFKL